MLKKEEKDQTTTTTATKGSNKAGVKGMISKDFKQQLLAAAASAADLEIANLYSEDISLYLGVVTFDDIAVASAEE